MSVCEYIVGFNMDTSTTTEVDGVTTVRIGPELHERIVRCRDCRFFRIGTNTDSCGFTDKYAHSNGFCSWGERKADA